MLELLQSAKKAGLRAKDVLFDSWFASPKTIIAVKDTGYDVIAMIKKHPKYFYGYDGEKLTMMDIYRRNRKRRGRSKYLLSILATVYKDGRELPVRLVYVRNRSNRKDYLCLISTDTSLTEEEIIRRYGRRWKIKVFFKVCKSHLRLAKECRSLSYDAMSAHVVIVFARYMMLSVKNRESEDPRTMGELFRLICDELEEAPWVAALEMLMKMFIDYAEEHFDISEQEVSQMVDGFMMALPDNIRWSLNVA